MTETRNELEVGVNKLEEWKIPLLSQEGWREAPGWFQSGTSQYGGLGTTPRTTFGRAALLTQEGSSRISNSS